MKYILGVDQSTQGTKVALFDDNGRIVCKLSKAHRQIVDGNGYVSHDAEEIYNNLIFLVKEIIRKAAIDLSDVVAAGISNQRETSLIWGKDGKPLGRAVVWQCNRGKDIVDRLAMHADIIRNKTGLPLSPYFSAAKLAWLIQNTNLPKDVYCLGTMDSFLIYRLTKGKSFYTDYSNAGRTQLYDIGKLRWDDGICGLFGIPTSAIAEVIDSNGVFGYTDFEGILESPIPIRAILGDSNSALFAHNCRSAGTVKATYGTGSSIMMNVGEFCLKSKFALATSLAWRIEGNLNYVLEGNINYAGAIISWLKNDMQLIYDESEIETLISQANENDETVFVPAFSGLSAPYWNEKAKALLYGMTRISGKPEIVKAAVESIAFQVNDVLCSMTSDYGGNYSELKADGGASSNCYLMQLQSNLSGRPVLVSKTADLSLCGVAYLAGQSCGLYGGNVFANTEYNTFSRQPLNGVAKAKIKLWDNAVKISLSATDLSDS